MKVLVVGDVHATAQELDEVGRLFDFIEETVRARAVDNVIFLGDLFHSHVQVNAKVLDFYRQRLARLTDDMLGTGVVLITGNHDLPGDGSRVTPLSVFSHWARVVNKEPWVSLDGRMAAISYCQNQQEMDEAVAQLPRGVEVVFGHQTVDGSVFDNGFAASDALDIAGLPGTLFVSGHLHRPQRGAHGQREWYYPGAPRSRTLSDANTPRSVLFLSPDPDVGWALDPILVPDHVCHPIHHLVWDDVRLPMPPPPDGPGRVIYQVQGLVQEVADMKAQIRAACPGAKVNAQVLSGQAPKVKEGEAFAALVSRWLDIAPRPSNTPAPRLLEMLNAP